MNQSANVMAQQTPARAKKVLSNATNPLESAILQLKKRVIGQDKALEKITTSLFFHKKIRDKYLAENSSSRTPISTISGSKQPPILLTGTTGTGKTHLIKEVCKELKIKPICIDAACLVRTGIVGQSVDDIGRRILESNNYDIGLAEYSVVFLDEFDKLLTHNGSSILPQLLTLLEGSAPLHIAQSHQDRNSELPESLRTDKMLFILGGSFQAQREVQRNSIGFCAQQHLHENLQLSDLKTMGIPSELLGRVGQIVQLEPLSFDVLVDIFKHSTGSPLQRLKNELSLFDCTLETSTCFIDKLAQQANAELLGARALFQEFENLPAVLDIKRKAVSLPQKKFTLTEKSL